jgi:hypothetical protein
MAAHQRVTRAIFWILTAGHQQAKFEQRFFFRGEFLFAAFWLLERENQRSPFKSIWVEIISIKAP